MPESEDHEEVSNTDLRNSQFGGGFINAENVNAGRIGGDIHITNYYYREDIQVAAVKPAPDDSTNEELPCPYRSLYHFSPDDAEYFFGREVFIEELFTATQTRNFIPVLGASGSGKSSVVLAGLVPKLQQEGHWLFTHFRPGSEPFYALAQALVPLYEPEKNATEQMYQARQLAEYLVNGSVLLLDVFQQIARNYANHRILLIVDQFEELYTLCSNEKIRRSFLDTLLAGFQSEEGHFPSPPVLVSTMRVDFLGNALAYPPFADVLRNADIKIRSMNRSELSEVIACPAQKLGITFQDGLIERILDDVESEPGNLPLLEFALTLLWEKRTNKQLTHAAYEAIGEVQGALASHADTIYKNLNAVKQQQVSRIFMQLVRPGEGTEDTRRVATKAEIGEENWSLVQDLADARLVVTSRSALEQETIEVAHEALIRHWQLLQSWIDENRSQIIQKNRIERLADEWEAHKKSPDYLLQGKQLNEAQAFQKKESANLKLSSLATEFIQKSITYRRNNRFRLIGFGFIPLVALAVFLGWVATREIKARQMWAIVEQAKGEKDSFQRIYALEELVKLGVSLNNIPLNGANLNGANLNGANLNGANLNGANLNGAYLTSANLTSAKLNGAILNGANLSFANLNGANLTSAKLNGANLTSAKLNGAILNGANLSFANLSFANLSFANLSFANLNGANLIGANLTSANLSFANLNGAILNGANLESAELNDAKLNGAILNGANLTSANLNGAILNGANLSFANLNRAILSFANLSFANLNGANLESAMLNDANLNGAELNGAILNGAELNGAILNGANLESAMLNGANLNGANLESANLSFANLKSAEFGCRENFEGNNECTNLSDAKNLTPEQVKAAKNWQLACYSPEFRKQLGLPPDTQKECKN